MKRLFAIPRRRYVAGLGICFALVVSLTLAVGTGPVAASANKLKIAREAHLDWYHFTWNGVVVVLELRCAGGSGSVSVTVSQSALQAGTGIANTATKTSTVACDGKPRNVAVNVTGPGPAGGLASFNLGDADVSATLTAPSGAAAGARTVEVTT